MNTVKMENCRIDPILKISSLSSHLKKQVMLRGGLFINENSPDVFVYILEFTKLNIG